MTETSKKHNDWICPQCGNSNYEWRTQCNMRKCLTPRPGAGAISASVPIQVSVAANQKAMDGDWLCPKCGNNNYARRVHCNMRKCGFPRPAPDGGQATFAPPVDPAAAAVYAPGLYGQAYAAAPYVQPTNPYAPHAVYSQGQAYYAPQVNPALLIQQAQVARARAGATSASKGSLESKVSPASRNRPDYVSAYNQMMMAAAAAQGGKGGDPPVGPVYIPVPVMSDVAYPDGGLSAYMPAAMYAQTAHAFAHPRPYPTDYDFAGMDPRDNKRRRFATKVLPFAAAGRPPTLSDDEDWNCPQCGNLNYASRKECNMRKCRAPRPPTNWKCNVCGNINYPSRLKCNMRKCGAPRPGTPEDDKPGRSSGPGESKEAGDQQRQASHADKKPTSNPNNGTTPIQSQPRQEVQSTSSSTAMEDHDVVHGPD